MPLRILPLSCGHVLYWKYSSTILAAQTRAVRTLTGRFSPVQERRVRSRQSKRSSGAGDRPDVQQEISGVLLAAAGVWALLSLADRGGGKLGEALRQGLHTLVGPPGAWVVGLFLIWLGFYLIYLRFQRRSFVWGRRSWGLLLLFASFELLVQLWEYGDQKGGGYLDNAVAGLGGGGLVGWSLAWVLTTLFGPGGRYVVLVTALLVGLLLNTELTLGAAIHWLKEKLFAGARSARGAAGDFYKLVTTRPEREVDTAEREVGASRRRRRSQAVSEDLNTIAPAKKAPAEADPPRIKINMPEERSSGQPASPHPAMVDDPVTAMDGRASRSVQKAVDRGQDGAGEAPKAKLVANDKGQLALAPEELGDAYQLPSLDMLPKPAARPGASPQDHLERAKLLERTLRTFGVGARVIEISPGPAVTRFELRPDEGVRVNKFTALADDLALALAAEDIRIEAPIPGKAAVGIEVPNKERLMVPLREVMETPAFLNSPSKLTVAFGKDNGGNPVVGDLSRMPHLLIAGATGSGKSVCMNTIICSILLKARPDEVKMLMIDPKMVELSTYNGIPHLMAPVVTDPKKAAGYLKGAVKEMENRYELFAASGVRNIQQYNQLVMDDPGDDPENPRRPLPYIVIFVDELADLMMVAPADVEDSICRLAQMARACGMHLVIATQSPRVDVITGLIKANIPSRIAFAVSSQVDSRVVLDYTGAERLLGRGDMLYHPAGLSKAIRAQGAFIAEKDVERLVKFVKAQAKPVYTAKEVAVEPTGSRRGSASVGESGAPSAVDEAFPEAVRIVIEHGQASVSILQRRLRCNYNKAARLIDMMEERGFIGPHQGSKPREVLITLPQWQELFGGGGSDLSDGEAAPVASSDS